MTGMTWLRDKNENVAILHYNVFTEKKFLDLTTP